MREIKATLLVMYYVTDENKNQVELREALDAITVAISTESVSAVGMTMTIDGIECYGINGTINKNTYITGRSEYSGNGNAIFVDKNHDLCWYFTGSDYVDEAEPGINFPINSSNKYGYEWGGYEVETGVTDTAIGSGLSNTNSLIGMNLQPRTSGWYVIWDKIKEFRQSHSDKWFLPSKDELNLIYEARSNLNNLSLNKSMTYWSSSEYSNTPSSNWHSENAWYQSFKNSWQSWDDKWVPCNRSRLCRQY